MPGLSQVLDELKLRGLLVDDIGVDLEAFLAREYTTAAGLPVAGGGSGTALFQVPASENWRIFVFSFQLTQAGGASAPSGCRLRVGPTGARLNVPIYVGANLGATAQATIGLNTVTRFIAVLPPGGMMMPPLSGIVYEQDGGDGVLTGVFQLFFQRIQSNQLIQF